MWLSCIGGLGRPPNRFSDFKQFDTVALIKNALARGAAITTASYVRGEFNDAAKHEFLSNSFVNRSFFFTAQTSKYSQLISMKFK